MTNKPYAVRHGEVILQPINSLPTEAQLEKTTKKEIIAHSGTGHHHVLEATKPFKVYTWNGETYLEVPELAELGIKKQERTLMLRIKLFRVSTKS